MEISPLQFPEVVGKSILELSVFDDPLFGREVLLRFNDGTQLSISIGVKQSVEARYYLEGTPDIPFFVRQDHSPGTDS